VFIIVHEEIILSKVVYRVEIVSVQDVPDFGPPLPEKSAIFSDKKELEQFLIAKRKYAIHIWYSIQNN
jgi:hypothetical protein